MPIYLSAIEFTATFLLLVLMAYAMLKAGLLEKTQSVLFSRLIVNVVLPSLLFEHLSKIKVNADILFLSSSLIVVEMMTLLLAYLAGHYLLRLPRPSLGIFALSSTIGSTAILGTAYITYIFKGEPSIIGKGLLVSQLAVGLPAYILMPLICIWHSEESEGRRPWLCQLGTFARTPAILAVIAGLSWSLLDLDTEGVLLSPLFSALAFVGQSLMFLTAIMVALTISRVPLKKSILPVATCSFFVLIFEPMALSMLQTAAHFEVSDQQLSFFLISMPTAYSVIAYAVRYKLDVSLASSLVMCTNALSALSIPSLMPILPMFGVTVETFK
jgi:predicted permease